MLPLVPNGVSMPPPVAVSRPTSVPAVDSATVPQPTSIPAVDGSTVVMPPSVPADPVWPSPVGNFVEHSGGSASDGFTILGIVGGGISGFRYARKLYLVGGGILSGVEAASYDAGTILECTFGADTVLSTMNATIFAGIAMPPGTPSPLLLAQYTRFSLQLIRPTGLPPFWQLEI